MGYLHCSSQNAIKDDWFCSWDNIILRREIGRYDVLTSWIQIIKKMANQTIIQVITNNVIIASTMDIFQPLAFLTRWNCGERRVRVKICIHVINMMFFPIARCFPNIMKFFRRASKNKVMLTRSIFWQCTIKGKCYFHDIIHSKILTRNHKIILKSCFTRSSMICSSPMLIYCPYFVDTVNDEFHRTCHAMLVTDSFFLCACVYLHMTCLQWIITYLL